MPTQARTLARSRFRPGAARYLDAGYRRHHAAARVVATDGYDCPVVMMSGHGTVETAVEATRLGAFDFVEKPLSLDQAAAHGGARARRRRRKRHAGAHAWPDARRSRSARAKIMQALREQVQQVAPQRHAGADHRRVGTGREAFARYMHSLSRARAGPFCHGGAASLSEETPPRRCTAPRRDGEHRPACSNRRPAGAVHQRAGGFAAERATRCCSARIEQNGYITRVGGRQRVQAQRALHQLGAGRASNRTHSPEPLRRELLSHSMSSR